MPDNRNVIVYYPVTGNGHLAGETYAVKDEATAAEVHPYGVVIGYESQWPQKLNEASADYLNDKLEAIEALQDGNGKFMSDALATGSVTREKLGADVAAAVGRGVDAVRRDYPLAKVMASPPTIGTYRTLTGGTAPAAAASVISNAKRYMPTETDAYRIFAGAAKSDTQSAWRNPALAGTGIDSTNADPYFTVDFECDCSQIEILVGDQNQKVSIWVDGELISADPISTTNTGAPAAIPLTFAGRAPRRIAVLAKRFWGVFLGPNDTIWRSSMPLGPRVIVLGDSFAEGTGVSVNAAVQGFIPQLGGLMGWPDIWASGSGGTGYLAPGSAGRKKLRDRVQTDVIAFAPDVVIVEGGINDLNYNPGSGVVTAAQIGAEAGLLFAAIKTGLPQAILIVLGPMWPRGTGAANVVQTRDALFAAARAHGAMTVDNLGGPEPYSGTAGDYTDKGWMTGTGRVGATTGSGNADLYTSSDNTHPTDAGHLYLARRIARGLVAAGVKV